MMVNTILIDIERVKRMNLYFDHTATTKVCEESIEAMIEMSRELYGNPSSLYQIGLKAEKKVLEAKKYFASFLSVDNKDIYFTSGGTESNNLAIQGIARAYKRSGNHIITSSIEHASVGNCFSMLEEEGFKVTYLSTDRYGHIDASELKNAITDETILVSIMHVNNEIGTVAPLKEYGRVIKETNKETIFHIDGVQGFMKLPMSIKEAKVDLYTASSHKISGPKGVGLIYIKNGIKIKPLFYGGSQQRGIRPGTENVPGIVGFYCAAKQMSETMEERYMKTVEIKNYFMDQMKQFLPDWEINSQESNGNYKEEISSPYIVSVRSKSLKGEVILHGLEDYGISVSTGSACSSKKLNVSHVLKAIGLQDTESDRSIRISFSPDHVNKEIDALIEALKTIDTMFGKFIKR